MMSVGEVLKNKRLSEKKTLNFVSKELKISTDILNNLENDQVLINPDMVFLIGHLRSYSNLLNLDTDQIIKDFKEQHGFSKVEINNIMEKPDFNKFSFGNTKLIPMSLIVIIFGSIISLFVSIYFVKLFYKNKLINLR